MGVRLEKDSNNYTDFPKGTFINESDKYVEGPCILYLSSFSQVLSLCHLSVDVRACKRR